MQINEDEVRNRLKGKIGYDVKVKDLAKEFSVSPAFMSMVLAGKRDLTEPMLTSVGVKKVITFEILEQGRTA